MTHIFLKLLKFILVTRFTKPTLILFAIFSSFIFIGLLTPSPPTGTGGPPYYTVGILAFLLFVTTLGAGLLIFKSDVDYLLTLPVDRTRLGLALFTSQFLGSAGITVLFIAPSARIFVVGTVVGQVIVIASIVLLSLVATSLSVVCHRFTLPARAGLGSVLAFWIASPLLGFPFSPTSVFTGDPVDGAIAAVAAGVVTFYLAFRDLLRVRVGVFRTLNRTTTGTYRSQRSFLGLSPLGALYRYHFSLFEFAGRVNMAGGSSYRASRIRIQYILAATSVLAVIYSIVALNLLNILPTSTANGRASPLEIIPFVATIIITLMIPLLLAQSGVANERAWLAFTSMPATRYLRHFLASRFLSTLLLLAPFILANLVLSILGSQVALKAAIAITLFTPSLSVLTTYVGSRAYPFQIKELGLQPAQYSLRQMLTVMPSFAALIPVALALLNALVGLVVSLGLFVLVALVLRSDRILQGLVFHMTENGFV
jgi:hypothetical protein